MRRYFLHIAVRLQIGTRHVQRNIRRIQHSPQQHHVFGNHSLHAVCYEHLIAIKLYLVSVGVYVLPYLRKIQYSGEVERIIDVQVNVEQRLVEVHGV